MYAWSTFLFQAQETWEEFKYAMIRQFHFADTYRNKVELVKSALKRDGEDPQHFLVRVRHIADTLKKLKTEECARLLFLAGLSDHETQFCFDNFGDGNFEVLADLLRLSDNADCHNIVSEKPVDSPPASEKIEGSELEMEDLTDQDADLLNEGPSSEDKEEPLCVSATGPTEVSVPQPHSQTESPSTSPAAVSSRKRNNPEETFIKAEKEIPPGPNVVASEISNENIVMEKDATGKSKMLVKGLVINTIFSFLLF